MFDVVIIGGGIIGLLTAKELQIAGASVAVIEKNSPGQQASWAAGGILSPMRPWHYSDAVNAISSISQSVYQELSNELFNETGIDPEWLSAGMLVLHDEETADALTWCKQHDDLHELLSVEQLSDTFSHLKPLNEAALLRPNVATIRSHKLLAALRAFLVNHGVTFIEQDAKHLLTSTQHINGVQLESEIVKGGEYILCSGAWSPQLLPENITVDIHPVKGQMICFPPIELPNHCMVMDENRYIIPRKDGRMVVGSTREQTGFDAATTPQAFEELRDFAQTLYPALQTIEPDAHWAGLRPSSPNSIPYICRATPLTNLSLSAGHYRNGIVTAPASAQLMADIVLNRTCRIDPAPYQLTRP